MDIHTFFGKWVNIAILIATFLFMMGITSNVDTYQFKHRMKSMKPILFGFTFECVIMPGIAFGIGYLFKLDDISKIALIFTGSASGGVIR